MTNETLTNALNDLVSALGNHDRQIRNLKKIAEALPPGEDAERAKGVAERMAFYAAEIREAADLALNAAEGVEVTKPQTSQPPNSGEAGVTGGQPGIHIGPAA